MLKILVLSFLFGFVAGNCFSGWVRYRDSCYLFSNFVASWGEAEYMCSTLNSKLVQMETKSEDQFVKHTVENLHLHDSNINNVAYWIGAHDIMVEGEFMWMPARMRLNYTDWEPNQPDNAHPGIEDEDCVEIRGSSKFKWNDRNCSYKRLFICEASDFSQQPEPDIVG